MLANTGYGLRSATCWVTFVILFKFVYSQKAAGDVCKFALTNTTGQCKLLSECPKAIEDLRTHSIVPLTCGLQGKLPIVCCNEISSTENLPTSGGAVSMERKSKQKCKEYVDEYNTNISLAYIPGFEHPKQEICVHSNGLLIEGHKVRPREFPHMAAIGYQDEPNKKSWLCSGVLISDKFVLTAAHCLFSPVYGEPKYIRIGDLDLDKDEDDAYPQEFNVAVRFRHPEFKPPSRYNDIGLLKLDKMVKFTAYARPACLYTNSTLPSQNAIAMAWGRDDYASDASSHLLKETLEFFPHAACQKSYNNTNFKRSLQHGILDERQICAGARGVKDTCIMDTEALITYNKEGHCMYDVVGIISLSGGCSNAPSVFTRVSAYIPWIEEIVWSS